MRVVEVSVAESQREVRVSRWQTLLNQNRLFRFLSDIQLQRYPFNLQGEAYLNSGWKRGLDIVIASTTAPVWLGGTLLGVALMKLEDPLLPALIHQHRHTLGNQKFGMYKVRSQVANSSENGQIVPTRIGNLLRKLSVDELPQFINILKGEMSVIGRRPTLDFDLINLETRLLVDTPYNRAKEHFGFTDKQWREDGLDPEQRKMIEAYAAKVQAGMLGRYNRFIRNNGAKPALTGLYQVLGRRRIEPEVRIELDYLYDRKASLGLDLAILLSTIPAVLSRKGAY